MAVRNKGPKTQRTNGNLGRRLPNLDGVALFVMNGVAVSGKAQLNTLYNIQDMASLGIDANYDITNKVLVHHHLSRALLYNPSIEAYFFLVPQQDDDDAHITPDKIADKDNPYLVSALAQCKLQNIKVKLLGIAYNPEASYEAVISAGIDSTAALAKAELQATLQLMEDDYQFMHSFLEARAFAGTVSALTAVDALSSNLLAPRISFVIASEDTSPLQSEGAPFTDFASIGAAIGMWSLAAISENPGNPIARFNLTRTAEDAFITPVLSGGVALPTDNLLLNSLETKGYIFVEPVAEADGLYFNDSRTCVPVNDDYAYIEANRTIDKALLIAKKVTTPLTTKARLQVDSVNGELTLIQRTLIEDAVKDAVGAMQKDGDISGGISAVIPAGINVLAGDPIYIDLTFVPVAIGREVTVRAGMSNPFNN